MKMMNNPLNTMRNTTKIMTAKKAKISQHHGEHIDAVMDAQAFINEHVENIVSDSRFLHTVQTDVVFQKKESYNTNVHAFINGDPDFGILSLIVSDKNQEHNFFASAYPVFFGKGRKVVIEKVWVWDNLFEATVQCTVNDVPVTFFAADYYANKDKYQPGAEVELKLGAWGLHVDEAQHGFDMEGQAAVDFLAKSGDKPEYDEDGNVKPLHFDTTELVAFLQFNEAYPDVAEFQSPSGVVRKREYLNIAFSETEICIDPEEEVMLPLVFRKEFLPKATKGTPLSGHLWVVGKLA